MSKPVTILQVLPSMKGGGVERGTIEIATALIANNMKSIVLSKGGPMTKSLEATGTTHITLDVATKNPLKIIANINKIVKIIKDNQIDLVHVRSRAPAWSVYYATKKANIPMLSTYHGIYGIKPKIKKLYNAIMLKGVKIIAISEFIKKHILDNYNVDEDKIIVIPRGADTEKFNPANITPEDIQKQKQEWQIPNDKPVIFMPTRISPTKRIEIFIEAVKDIPDVFCAVVGSDHGKEAYKKSLVAMVKKLKMDDRFRFYPPISNIEVGYAISDMVVTSIRPEAFGRTITEAQAMGKIPIAANNGAATEIIKDGENGFLVDMKNPNSTKEAILTYLDLSEKEQKEMMTSAIHNVVSKYSVSQLCESTIHLYNDILS